MESDITLLSQLTAILRTLHQTSQLCGKAREVTLAAEAIGVVEELSRRADLRERLHRRYSPTEPDKRLVDTLRHSLARPFEDG